MKTNCDYCGAILNDSDIKCSNCGADNTHYRARSAEIPSTIIEFQKWYQDNKLPPENITRFFIGKNTKEPKAYGIYEESKSFIVYENKPDGSRYVHYDGGDEAYAVNELFQKLHGIISRRNAQNKKI